jgi:hypothetical protein
VGYSLIGHSLGGNVAMVLAACVQVGANLQGPLNMIDPQVVAGSDPAGVRRLVLLDITGPGGEPPATAPGELDRAAKAFAARLPPQVRSCAIVVQAVAFSAECECDQTLRPCCRSDA